MLLVLNRRLSVTPYITATCSRNQLTASYAVSRSYGIRKSRRVCTISDAVQFRLIPLHLSHYYFFSFTIFPIRRSSSHTASALSRGSLSTRYYEIAPRLHDSRHCAISSYYCTSLILIIFLLYHLSDWRQRGGSRRAVSCNRAARQLVTLARHH